MQKQLNFLYSKLLDLSSHIKTDVPAAEKY